MKKLILLGIVMFGAATVASVFVKNQSNESDGKPDKKPVQFNHEQIAKPPVDAKIIKDAAFINEVQKTQGIAKAIARKFGFLKHSSPEVDKLNGVYRSRDFDVPFVVIDTNIICALKLPIFFGIQHVKSDNFLIELWGSEGKDMQINAIISVNSNGNMQIRSLDDGQIMHLERIDLGVFKTD